jgi:hypothetical protein
MLQYVVPGAMPAADQRLKKTGGAGIRLPNPSAVRTLSY